MSHERWNREETGCQSSESPIMCANNCGFFGSAATMNMCSKCFRESALKPGKALSPASELESPVSSSVPTIVSQKLDLVEPSPVSSKKPVEVEAPKLEPTPTPKVNANRCTTCKKRVGLTGFKCRCEGVYCSLHRYSDKHECSYDYKSAGRDAIAKANPVVKAGKVDKI